MDWSDWLKIIGSVGSGISENAQANANRGMSDAQFKAALAEKIAEFQRTQGLTEDQAAVTAQGQLNRAPLADRAQFLLTDRMQRAPAAFQPRDFTRGLDQIAPGSQPTGGRSAQLAANQAAASAYKAGDGGVDTGTLKMLLSRLKGNAGTPPSVSAPPATIPTAAPSPSLPQPPTSPAPFAPVLPGMGGALDEDAEATRRRRQLYLDGVEGTV